MNVFTEEQRFDQWWFRLLIMIILIASISPFIFGYAEISKNTMSILVTISTLVFAIALLGTILFLLKLETKIDETGVHYGFWPFHLKPKIIRWNEIKKIHVRKYSPISEYGGWGYRAGFGRSSGAMNVKGNIGIQIVLDNNKKLLIGTQKQNEVERVLQTYKHKISSL